jgi:hypothetical protein
MFTVAGCSLPDSAFVSTTCCCNGKWVAFPETLTMEWSLPSIPTDALAIGVGVLAVVLVFAVIGHLTSIARARRDLPQIANDTLHVDGLRRRMDALARQADQMIDAYRRQAFQRGREG